jgi:hypothetical protein
MNLKNTVFAARNQIGQDTEGVTPLIENNHSTQIHRKWVPVGQKKKKLSETPSQATS